jgi:hypothetical protein
MAQAGGRSQAEERLCEAAAILGIRCRRKAMYGGLFRKTKLMSVPCVELVGKQGVEPIPVVFEYFQMSHHFWRFRFMSRRKSKSL